MLRYHIPLLGGFYVPKDRLRKILLNAIAIVIAFTHFKLFYGIGDVLAALRFRKAFPAERA